MASGEASIRRGLAAAAAERSGPLLLKAHRALMQLLDRAGLDLLVLDAEAALQVLGPTKGGSKLGKRR